MGKQREEQVVSGLHPPTRCRTPRYDVRHPAPTAGTPPRDTGEQEHANPSLAAQDPPWLPPAPRLRSAWGRLSPLAPGRAVGRRPGSSPRSAGLLRAHITSSGGGGGGGGGGGEAPLAACPPRRSLRLLRAPAGPSHSLAIFRVALSAQLSPRRRLPPRLVPLPPLCATLAPAETPLPAHPDPAVRWGPPRCDQHGTGEHEGGTWEPVSGSGAVRLLSALGRCGGRGLFHAAPLGTPAPVLSRDLCGGARPRGGGSAVGGGFGGSDPRVGSSRDPRAQPVLRVLAFHTAVTGGYRGPPWGRGDVPPDGWVGLVARCSSTPCLALRGGVLPAGPGRDPLGIQSVGWWVPTGAARPLARGQAQNKPRLSGRAGCPGQKISLPSSWHLLTVAGWPAL